MKGVKAMTCLEGSALYFMRNSFGLCCEDSEISCSRTTFSGPAQVISYTQGIYTHIKTANGFETHQNLRLRYYILTRFHLDPFFLCVPYILVLYASLGEDEANSFCHTATVEIVQFVRSHLVT